MNDSSSKFRCKQKRTIKRGAILKIVITSNHLEIILKFSFSNLSERHRKVKKKKTGTSTQPPLDV